MNTKNEKKGFLEIAGVQTVIASLICIILGLLVGYIVLFVYQSLRSLERNERNPEELFILPQT